MWHLVQVKAVDSDSIRELLYTRLDCRPDTDVFSSRVEIVVVIQVTHGRKERLSSVLLERKYQALFPRVWHFKHLNDRTSSDKSLAHDRLVNFQGVRSGLFVKELVRHKLDVSRLFGSRLRYD